MLFNIAGASSYGNFIDIMITVLFVLATLCSVVVAIWLLVKYINMKTPMANSMKILFAVFAAGFLLRVILSFVSAGNRLEMYAVYDAVVEWSKYGPATYIKRTYFKTGQFLYPLHYLLVGVTAGNAYSMGLGEYSLAMQFILKFPMIIADMFTAYIIYSAAKKYLNENVAIILSGVVLLCPVFIFASAVWTSVYSLVTPFIVGSVYAIACKKNKTAICLYGLSLLICREASYLFPLFAVYYVYLIVKYLISLSKGTKSEVTGASVAGIILTSIVMVVVRYVICLPLTIQEYSGDFFAYVYNIYFYPLKELAYYSNNGLSVYNVLMRGGWETDIIFRDQNAAWFISGFAIVITALTLVLYFSRKNRAILALTAAFVFFLLNTVYFDFSATAMVPTLMLMLLSFIFIKDKRILRIFFCESVLLIILMCSVFISGQYFGNASMDLFFTNKYYTGLTQLTSSTGGLIVLIILSVASIALLIYNVKIIMNIAMTDEIAALGGNEKIKPLPALKYFIKK